jgi:H+/Na+-translocating ferredoxin:NAD+ oxidoreductase subunit G
MTDKAEAIEVAGKDDAPEPQQDSAARLVLTLTIVAMVAGAALTGAHALTKGPIKAAKARKKLASIKKVLPKCTNNPVKDAIKVSGPQGKTLVYRCRKRQPDGSTPVVAVAIGQTSEGNKYKTYSGLIRVMVGIDAKSGKIRSYKNKKGKQEVAVVIVKHSETPGLGSKATDYDFRKAYAGQDLKPQDKTSEGKVWLTKKDNPLGFVDAISGATITSRAVTEIVKKALVVFTKNKVAILTTVKTGAKTGAKPEANTGAAPAKEKQP